MTFNFLANNYSVSILGDIFLTTFPRLNSPKISPKTISPLKVGNKSPIYQHWDRVTE